MPASRSTIFGPMNRFSPLARANYTIPPSLPAPYGVTGLYDWSAPTPSSQASSMPATPSSLSVSSYVKHRCVSSLHHKSRRSVDSTSSRSITVSPPSDTSSDVLDLTSPSSQAASLPLFRPSSSPTPIKRGSSKVSLPLPNSSPCARLREKSTPLSSKGSTGSTASNLSFHSAQSETELSSQPLHRPKPSVKHTNPAPSTLSSSEESDEEESDDDQDLEGFIVPDSPKSDREDLTNSELRTREEPEESEDDSDNEAPPIRRSGSCRFIDDSAGVSKSRRKAKSGTNGGKTKQSGAGVDNHGPWTGEKSGPILFRKRPRKVSMLAPATWSYSGDGVTRKPVGTREVGDIHFSPAYSGSTGFDYWVCVDSPKRWVKCWEGQSHPFLDG
ncbi:hypothetical protein FRC11_004666, partial [Ceratobasidium sp. 423]